MLRFFMFLYMVGFSGLLAQAVGGAEFGIPKLLYSQQTDITDLLSTRFFRMRLSSSILDSVRFHAAVGNVTVQIQSGTAVDSDSLQTRTAESRAITRDAAYTFYKMLTAKERQLFKNLLVEVRRDFIEYDSGMKDLSFGDEDEIILEFGFNFNSFESTSLLLKEGLFADPLKAFVAYSEREIAGEVWSNDLASAVGTARKRQIREFSCIPEKLRVYFRHINYAAVQK
ncbi:MAG: hypothetical protein HOH43_24845 [Candidatus Latescibacteria bacterium]|nr:hypothetical protein [Candidatus Latescibacterota bacterium]